jgi:hypothetical protein
MLPPLDALSLSSHNASPTGVRDANPRAAAPPRRRMDLNSIIAKQEETSRVTNRASQRRGGTAPDYDQDTGPGRMFLQNDNVCPMCPDEYGELNIKGEELGPIEYDEYGNMRYDEYGNPLRLPRKGWLNRQVEVDPDTQVKHCARCGTELAKYTQDAQPEKRNFADEEGVDRSQHSAVTAAEQMHLNYISPEEMGMAPDNQAVWTVNNRLQQCFVWLEKMQQNPVTYVYRWWLSASEVLRAKRLLRAVCVLWGRGGMASTPEKPQNGNPIQWSIYAALQMTAERENGFAVRTAALQQLLTIDGLHGLLGHFEAEMQRTDENLYNATIARGPGAAGAWLIQKQKYRKPDYDAIPVASRPARMMYFNGLVKNSRFLGEKLDEKEGVVVGIGMNMLVVTGKPPDLLPPQSFPVYN